MSEADRPVTAGSKPGVEPELSDVNSLDLRGCHRWEISVGLFEHETAGLRFETWPAAVRARVEKELADWCAKHPERSLRSITTSATAGNCIMVLHHGLKGGA